MNRNFTLFAIVAAAALAGCDNSDHTITADDPADPTANAAANLQDVQLPPAIVASHTYRCQDNSLAYVEWLDNDTARYRTEQNGPARTVTMGEDGNYTAEDLLVAGAPNDESITINGQTCRRG